MTLLQRLDWKGAQMWLIQHCSTAQPGLFTQSIQQDKVPGITNQHCDNNWQRCTDFYESMRQLVVIRLLDLWTWDEWHSILLAVVTAQTVADVNTGLRGGMQLGQHSSCSCCHVSSLSWLGRGGGVVGWGRCATGSTLQLLLLSCIQFVMFREGGWKRERRRRGRGLGRRVCSLCAHKQSGSTLSEKSASLENPKSNTNPTINPSSIMI